MYEIVQIEVEAVGSGLLMHNPTGMATASGTSQRAGKKIPEPMDEAIQSLYVIPNETQLYASADWFREAAIIAAKQFRDKTRPGRATMMQRFQSSVFQSTEYFPLVRASYHEQPGTEITSDQKDWEMYLKRVVIQGSGIIRARANVRDWACVVEYEYDNEVISPEEIAPIMHMAGKFPGVGDYRPGRKGPFGRFQVVALGGEPWNPEAK